MESDDPDVPIGRSGSATLISYKNEKFVILTKHQLGFRAQQLPAAEILNTIRISTGQEHLHNIPLSNCIYESSNADEEFNDILIFDVDEEYSNLAADAPYYIPLNPIDENDRRIISYIFGYPSSEIDFTDYWEKIGLGTFGNIHSKQLAVSAGFDSKFISAARYLQHHNVEVEAHHYDGLSGGPVISLVERGDGYEFLLDGIILRGGNGSIYSVSAAYIEYALQSHS